jgi:hypothetical protein
MMIGYDIWVRFTMEHCPLRQSMNLTTSYFCSGHIVQSIRSFTLQKRYRKVYTWQVSSIRHIINVVEFATLGGCRSPRHTGE